MLDIYYKLKPFIPRSLQIWIRRIIVRNKLKRYSHIWPIDERAGKPPEGWQGWPDGKKFALVLTHDVESEKGLKNVIELAKLEESMGFKSSFNFVAEDYEIPQNIFDYLKSHGFEIGLHGLTHNGNIFRSYRHFKKQLPKINEYLKKWCAVGFRAPSMYRNLNWVGELNIEYDSSTFDTDPFEPQPNGACTIFPFFVPRRSSTQCTMSSAPCEISSSPHALPLTLSDFFIELPYTLPQDHLLFILLQEKDITIWKKKLEWIAGKGGMALLNVHPDYMNFTDKCYCLKDYAGILYKKFLKFVQENYKDKFWNPLAKDLSFYWANQFRNLNRINSRNIRACMVSYSFFENDGRVRRYAESLAQRGDIVDVICLSNKGLDKNDNSQNINILKIQERDINEKGKKEYFLRLLKFWSKAAWILTKKTLINRYDLIHVHNIPDILVFSAIIPKLLRTKIILDIHDIMPELYANKFGKGQKSFGFRILKFIEKASCGFSDYVITSNHIWGEKLISRSIASAKLSVILNYPDENIFNKNLKNSQKKDKDKLIIIYPGTLNYHQGLDLAVKAFKLIKDKVPGLEFHIYGEGPEKPKLIELVNSQDCNGRIRINNSMHISQIAKIMARADMGIVPKRNDSFGGEAFSTKILEFMSLGIPVIVARTKIDNYYFNDSLVKFFEPENENDIARCIFELANNDQERKRLAENALEFVKDFTWGKRKQEYLDLVDRLIRS